VIAAASAQCGERSWTHVLLGAVRPEFRAEVYEAAAEDRVLGRCPRAGSDLEPVEKCAVSVCRRSVHRLGLCTAHLTHWSRAGRPERETFVEAAPRVETRPSVCAVPGCGFPVMRKAVLCDSHQWRFRTARNTRPGLEPEGYLALLRRERGPGPRFELSGLSRPLTLEFQFALQCRHDAGGAKLTPRVFGAVVGWAHELGVGSLLDGGDRFWRERTDLLRPPVSGQALAFLRYARRRLLELREMASGTPVWEWDTWPVDLLDPSGRWAHQPIRRVYFADIRPAWLRALAKRWGRWRISAATMSPASVEQTNSALRRLCGWWERAGCVPETPAELTRELLERFMAELRASDTGEARKRSILAYLKVFFDDLRTHGWEAGLPSSAVYHRGELTRTPRAVPRYIDEFVMGQIESEENLARIPDQATRTLVILLIETGLRAVDALRLRSDPITCDQASAPYLAFYNHKLSREAVIPISQRLVAEIRAQQAEVRARWPHGDLPHLFPRPWSNADGRKPLEQTTLRRNIARWLTACDVRDAQGRPVRVTPHQFRHTLGTRLVNNEVPLDTVRRLLDHDSPEMTARYATIKDQTLRREWERYRERINIRGELIPLDPDGPLSDAAWAKENLARAKQTLPNGYCGLPLQQRCPHPNACLTCDSFLSTAEFLPQHREQLERTRELIASARTAGNDRLVEMNEPVELNLVRIIDGLEALHHDQQEDVDAA
jgi:integrase